MAGVPVTGAQPAVDGVRRVSVECPARADQPHLPEGFLLYPALHVQVASALHLPAKPLIPALSLHV
jgi:hypothetical protein